MYSVVTDVVIIIGILVRKDNHDQQSQAVVVLSGATSINVPAIGSPRPVARAKALILNSSIGVEEFTNVWLLNSGDWLKSRKMYLVTPSNT